MKNKHLKLNHNKLGRDFIIGDLHGCYDLLMEKMDLVSFNKDKDRLFSVGDVFDRGRKSFLCLSLFNEDWFYPVIGNHEELMRDSLSHPDDAVQDANIQCWLSNGGGWALSHDKKEIMPYVENIKNNVPYVITIGEGLENSIGICHAQPPTTDWKDVDKEENWPIMTWGRSRIKNKFANITSGVSVTYHGHSVTKSIIRLGNSVFIDTGACHTGNLSMVEITNGKFEVVL
jgi:serine/threonine protein phosphatase 1